MAVERRRRAGDALTIRSISSLLAPRDGVSVYGRYRPPRPGGPPASMVIWSIAVVAVWGVAWLTYTAAAELTACGIGTAHGDVHNEYWAGPIGLPLLVIAGGLAWRWRRRVRRLLPLFAAFVTLYIGGLLILWATSPWGARCT